MADDTNARSIREVTYTVPEEALSLFGGERDAFCIWMFAMMKPIDWVFRKPHAQEQLKISRNKWRAAIKFLVSEGLLEVKVIKNSEGKFFGKRYEFYSINMRDKKRNTQPLDSTVKKPSPSLVTKSVTNNRNKTNDVAEGTKNGSSVIGTIYYTSSSMSQVVTENRPPESDMDQEEIERHRARFLKRFTGTKTFQTFDD